MIIPEISWTVGVGHSIGVVAAFAIGLATHEGMHVAVLEALREPYEATLAPNGWKAALTRGTLVDVQMKRLAPRWRVALVMLSPLVAATPALVAWAVAFTYPVVEVGTLAVLGVWFAFALPSPHDIASVAYYDPSGSVPAEVST